MQEEECSKGFYQEIGEKSIKVMGGYFVWLEIIFYGLLVGLLFRYKF